MSEIKIYATDYSDLVENFSEKNIVKNIYGKEYIVNSISNNQLDSRVIDPQTAEKVFFQKPYIGDNARSNIGMIVGSDTGAYKNFFGYGWTLDIDFARVETLYYMGSYEFTTDEVIDFEMPISCKFTINYTKSGCDALTKKVYNARNKTAFFEYGGQFPMLRNDGDDNLLTNNFLPAKSSSSKVENLWQKETIKVPMPSVEEYCRAKIIQKTSSSTKIRVEYKFKIWGGWATDNQKNNTVLAVNDITIDTVGNTLETNELDFDYYNIINNGKSYELDTNELFQADLVQEEETRQSYKTAQDIFAEYAIDKKIISFDLLNMKKYLIDDSIKYTDGSLEERYIDTDDEFEIFDEHNISMGTFKVLKCNSIWDGSYYKKIIAILVYN